MNSWLKYVKEAVDSVENQLDTILDTPKKQELVVDLTQNHSSSNVFSKTKSFASLHSKSESESVLIGELELENNNIKHSNSADDWNKEGWDDDSIIIEETNNITDNISPISSEIAAAVKVPMPKSPLSPNLKQDVPKDTQSQVSDLNVDQQLQKSKAISATSNVSSTIFASKDIETNTNQRKLSPIVAEPLKLPNPTNNMVGTAPEEANQGLKMNKKSPTSPNKDSSNILPSDNVPQRPKSPQKDRSNDKGTEIRIEKQATEEAQVKIGLESLTSESSKAPVRPKSPQKEKVTEIGTEKHILGKAQVKIDLESSNFESTKAPARPKSPQKDFDSKTSKKEIENNPVISVTILEQREQQLVACMKKNAELHDQLEFLNSQLSKAQQSLDEEKLRAKKVSGDLVSNINKLKKTITDSENEKLQLTKNLKQSSTALKQIEDLKTIVNEKEISIAGLLQEGENLSKEVLKANMSVKKYRKEVEDTKNELQELSKKYETAMTKIEQLMNKIQGLNEDSSQLEESNGILKDLNTKQGKRIKELESTQIVLNQKQTDMTASLASMEQLVEELRKKDSEAQAMLQSEALQKQMEKTEEVSRELSTYKQKVFELQDSLEQLTQQSQSRIKELEREHSSKEEIYQKQIKVLEQRLQTAEYRNEELYFSQHEITAPFLQQISSLEEHHRHARQEWEQTESVWIQKFQSSEQEKSDMLKKVTELTDRMMEMEMRLEGEQQQVMKLKSESGTLIENFNNQTQRNAELDETVQKLKQELKELAENRALEIQELKEKHKKEISQLRQQSQNEKQLRHDLKIEIQSSPTTPTSPLPSASDGNPKRNISGLAIGQLNSQLKQSKGQIQILENQVSILIRERDETTKQLVELEQQFETLNPLIEQTSSLKVELAELENRYSTVLELLGEKEEKILELEADIVDMKEAFRQCVMKE